MRLGYITTTLLHGTDAQSLQIIAMAKAFGRILGDSFVILGPQQSGAVGSIARFWRPIKGVEQPRSLRYLGIVLSLPRRLRFHRLTHVYTRDIVVAAMSLFLGRKTTYEMHKAAVGRVAPFLLRHLTLLQIVVISEALKQHISSIYNIPKDRISVLPDGVEAEDLLFMISSDERQHIRHDIFRAQKNEPVLLYTGSIQIGKGIDVCLSLALLIPQYRVVIAGGDAAQVSRFGVIPPNVVCIPRTSQHTVRSYMRAADVLILPTTKELAYYSFTSPLKLFEYMASGIPMLVSDVGAPMEIVDSSVAFLFSPDRLDQIIPFLIHLQVDPTDAFVRAKKAKERVRQFTWDARAKACIEHLQ